jgi:4-hydroxy-3-methylbut-2-enyl diphosphate reductase
MPLRIEKTKTIGFCSGVRRALDIVERAARKHGRLETLGAIVHNQPVLDRLEGIGVSIAASVDEVKGNLVVTSAHGLSPRTEQELRARRIDIIDTTCPFVHRAQIAARRLAKAGFFVIVYGDTKHPEVEGVLGWAGSNSLATLDERAAAGTEPLPRRLGILSQTTQVPAHFSEFVRGVIEHALGKDSELRIVDTICHDIRERQAGALKLAGRVELMLVIGGRSSANTGRLVQLCSGVTETRLIETAAEIQDSWFQGKEHIGIASGASTAQETIDEVISRLELIA